MGFYSEAVVDYANLRWEVLDLLFSCKLDGSVFVTDQMTVVQSIYTLKRFEIICSNSNLMMAIQISCGP